MATDSAPLFAHYLGDGVARTWPWSSCRGRPPSAFGPADHPFSGEAFEGSGCRDTQQAGDGNSTIGDNDLFASSRSLQPLAQVCSEITNGYVHDLIVQLDHAELYK